MKGSDGSRRRLPSAVQLGRTAAAPVGNRRSVLPLPSGAPPSLGTLSLLQRVIALRPRTHSRSPLWRLSSRRNSMSKSVRSKESIQVLVQALMCRNRSRSNTINVL